MIEIINNDVDNIDSVTALIKSSLNVSEADAFACALAAHSNGKALIFVGDENAVDSELFRLESKIKSQDLALNAIKVGPVVDEAVTVDHRTEIKISDPKLWFAFILWVVLIPVAVLALLWFLFTKLWLHL
ncbi:MAG: ATP-dependent Clp protease adaptor ClpS [Pseudomonadota bacterium]